VIAGRAAAVVTGAGNGLGAFIARRLAADGYAVSILDTDVAAGTQVAAEVDGRFVECDVADPDAVREAAERVGPAAVLVNNAGVTTIASVLDSTDEDLRRLVEVNLLGTVFCCRAFAPAMIAQGSGSIVNISSGAAAGATPGYCIYPSTKSAVETLTRQLAMEWGPRGIRVNAVGPGAIETERNGHRFSGDRLSSRVLSIPLRRTGVPQDIAGAISALCSEDLSYVTGQVLYVDGGLSAGAPGI
jgi:NAD(P)-dependent dehydrogenase (short-subunit alcohol dehydrogenase family)